MTGLDLLVGLIVGAAVGVALGAWGARRGHLRTLRELEAYLEGWLEGRRNEEEERARQESGARTPFARVYGRLAESRRTFLDLRASSELTTRQFQRLIDVVRDGVLVYNADGRLLFASVELRALAARAAGRPAAEAVAGPEGVEEVAAFVAAQPELRETVRRGLTGAEPETADVTLRVAGEERRFAVVAHRVPADDGGAAGLLLLLTPAELLRELRRSGERQVALDHLALAAELLAHRLRNPLNSIVLLVEVLRQERARAGEGASETHLETIQAEVTKLEATLASHLELMRHRERPPEAVNLASVVENVSELLYPLAREAGVQLRQELRVSSAVVRGDRAEITRALLGPALAALRAAGLGDELKLRLDSDRREHLLFVEAAALPRDGVEIAVAEDLAARNGGRVAYAPGPPGRLTFHYAPEG